MENLGESEVLLEVFLAEAEEIVQCLFAQLEELHYGYDGQRILDDIHRGFHTIYGGAAILGLPELAEAAQLAEKVLARLKSRCLSLSPSLVSLIVGVTSAIEVMLSRLLSGQAVRPMPVDLRRRLLRANGQETGAGSARAESLAGARLDVFFTGGQTDPVKIAGSEVPIAENSVANDGISDSEFEKLLDSLYGEGKGPTHYPSTTPVKRAEHKDGAAMVAELRDVVLPVHGREGKTPIGDLISELSWVRNRLQSFKTSTGNEAFLKALAYLDLVTQDMESWLDNTSR